MSASVIRRHCSLHGIRSLHQTSTHCPESTLLTMSLLQDILARASRPTKQNWLTASAVLGLFGMVAAFGILAALRAAFPAQYDAIDAAVRQFDFRGALDLLRQARSAAAPR